MRGVGFGLLAASGVVAGYGVALAVPALRWRLAELTDRGPGVPTSEWVAVHIPLGTVYSEELVFRGTLDPLLDRVLGPRAGALVGAAAFGLWHVAPARAVGDSVPATVVVTTAGGLVFGWLRRRTRGTVTPALLHLAMNVGGAIAPRLARRSEAAARGAGWRGFAWGRLGMIERPRIPEHRGVVAVEPLPERGSSRGAVPREAK